MYGVIHTGALLGLIVADFPTRRLIQRERVIPESMGGSNEVELVRRDSAFEPGYE